MTKGEPDPKCRPAARPRNPKCRCGTSPEPKVPLRGTSPEPWSEAEGCPGSSARDPREARFRSCLKAVTSRCAAHRCAGTRTRFRCAAPFRERAAWPHFRGARRRIFHPRMSSRPQRSGEPGSQPLLRIGSQSPHPEEQTRLGLRLEGRGWRWPRWLSLLESLVLRDAMRSRMAPQDEGFVLFAVDNIPISAILRSLFTQEGTLPERSVAGWGGGACGGGVPLRPPGRPPESGLAHRLTLCAKL